MLNTEARVVINGNTIDLYNKTLYIYIVNYVHLQSQRLCLKKGAPVSNSQEKCKRNWTPFIWSLVKRYAPMEIAGTFTAMLAGIMVYYYTGNTIAAAVAAAWSENIGFYGVGAYIESRPHYKNHDGGLWSHFKIFLKTLRNMITEFGLAEAGDTLLMRPFCMTLFQALLGAGAVGLFVGKIAADVLFYGLAAIGHRLSRRLYGDPEEEEEECGS